jgi:hypothetical protein
MDLRTRKPRRSSESGTLSGEGLESSPATAHTSPGLCLQCPVSGQNGSWLAEDRKANSRCGPLPLLRRPPHLRGRRRSAEWAGWVGVFSGRPAPPHPARIHQGKRNARVTRAPFSQLFASANQPLPSVPPILFVPSKPAGLSAHRVPRPNEVLRAESG